jgi:5-formyltetrahydrofolate cyclo-ligase
MISKAQLRADGLAARQAIPRARLLNCSRLVEMNLASQKEYREARVVASYVSKEDEVQTREMIQRMLSEGKRVAVPLVDAPSRALMFFEIGRLEDLSPGRFGILEPSPERAPVPLADCDLVLVPLVAWDDRGYRIGYGKGYFDRALADRGSPFSVGLALESQRVDEIPAGPSDVPLDMVVTEERVLRFHRRPA